MMKAGLQKVLQWRLHLRVAFASFGGCNFGTVKAIMPRGKSGCGRRRIQPPGSITAPITCVDFALRFFLFAHCLFSFSFCFRIRIISS